MNISLNQLKDEMVSKVIASLTDMRYMTSSERDSYKNQITAKVKSNLLCTTLRLQSGLTNADDYNQTAYELYLDILTTFGYVNRLYEAISAHQNLNQSIINTLTSNLELLNDKLDEYEATIGTAGSPGCIIEGFRTVNRQESNRKYYTERYGERMPLETWVKFNEDQENITLNYTRQQNVIVYKSGVQLGEIEITKQYGEGYIVARNQETKLSNAIDTSGTSYWAETILSDAEFKVRGMGFDDSDGLTKSNRSFYDLNRGALCEICITFEALAKVNEITLKPYGNYPLDIVAIRYSMTDAEDDEVYDVVYPDNEEEVLASTSIRKEHAFHFYTITCKKLYILINQMHCIKNTFMISANQMFKNELWFNATYDGNTKLKQDNTVVFKPNYIDRAQEEPIWKYIQNKMNTNKDLDINEMLIENNNRKIPMTKYQYTYGFYNIAPCFCEFQRAGIYVSKEIEVDGCIDQVKLISDETHNLGTDGLISTDIEFYITSKENPGYEDWIPICPTNKNYVHRELLQLDWGWCYLRHKAVCTNGTIVQKKYDEDGNEYEVITTSERIRPIVYYNDVVLTEDADYYLRYDNDGNVYAIEIAGIDHFGIYTCSYTPTDSSKVVSLVDTDNPMPSNTYEEIMGNGTASYKLSEYPYYLRTKPESTQSYVRIAETSTNRVFNQSSITNHQVECVTNKYNTIDSYKNFIANTNRIQYYTNGRYVYFNQPIAKDQKIEISYPSFASRIRLKAILRRNTKEDDWITPILNSYRLEFSTL